MLRTTMHRLRVRCRLLELINTTQCARLRRAYQAQYDRYSKKAIQAG